MKTIWRKLSKVILLAAIAAAACAVAQTSGISGSGKENGELMTLAAAGPVTLGSEPTQVVLEGRNLVSSLEAIEPNRRIFLILRDLYASEQPGVLYHILLDLPPGARPEKDDIHRVGLLSFYNSVPPQGGASSPNPGIFRSYEVTALVKGLQKRGALTEQTTVTIIPSGTLTENAKVSIGRIELVEH